MSLRCLSDLIHSIYNLRSMLANLTKEVLVEQRKLTTPEPLMRYIESYQTGLQLENRIISQIQTRSNQTLFVKHYPKVLENRLRNVILEYPPQSSDNFLDLLIGVHSSIAEILEICVEQNPNKEVKETLNTIILMERSRLASLCSSSAELLPA